MANAKEFPAGPPDVASPDPEKTAKRAVSVVMMAVVLGKLSGSTETLIEIALHMVLSDFKNAVTEELLESQRETANNLADALNMRKGS